MKRITLFAGHYGSGKTNLALNFALRLKRGNSAAAVTVADLDIVNPYFRTQDSAAELSAAGVALVVSGFANSNVDFPALPKEAYSLFAPRETPWRGEDYVIVDVGGDDRGALALGRYVDDIRASDYDMFGVVNFARPLTRTPEDAAAVLREIEAACRLPFTGVVNNTNLGPDTSAADVLASLAPARRVAEILGVPLVGTACAERLAPELEGKVAGLVPLEIQRLYYQLER